MIKYFAMAILLINIVTFLAFGIDKWKAKHDGWRIKEATLLILSLIGGAAGGLIGMHAFHHKTRKWYFRYLIPLILILQVALAAWLYLKYV